MKGSIYKLGMVLESKKNKYRVKYLNAINMYKTIGTHTIDKYYKVVE